MAKKSFEDNMERLVEIAGILEGGGSLSDALKLYKEAIKTAEAMKKELSAAEGKVCVMRKGADGVFMEDGVAVDGF